MFLLSLGCDLKPTQVKLMHGEKFSIKLPIWFKELAFTSEDELQSESWPSCAQHTRRYIKGSSYKRQFVISPVTFNDQGTYTRWNYRNQRSSIHKLEVVCKWPTMPFLYHFFLFPWPFLYIFISLFFSGLYKL